MSLIELRNVSKIYQVQDEQKYALRDVTFTLPSSGLVAIVGKSGSGKSTILNLIALNDKPSKGEVYFNGENVSKWGSAMVNEYHNRCIGMVFQHYHLLEDETGLLNVMLPMMVLGKSTKRCEEDAKTLFSTMGIEPQIYLKKVSEMSGGEKQRICFLRGLINAPYLLLADEPTGALDSKNSILTMELLKQASKKKLVVVVSHNNKLIETYADRIINISDGKVFSDTTINTLNNGIPRVKEPKFKKCKDWIDKITKTNLKKRKKINVFTILSLILGITSSIVITGFNVNALSSIQETEKCHLDYGVSTLTKETKTQKTTNGLSIVKTSRPSNVDLEEEKEKLSSFYLESNYDYLFPQKPLINFSDYAIENLNCCPIYSFENSYIDRDLLLKGNCPKSDNLKYCLINKQAEKLLKSFNEEILYQNINVNYQRKCIVNIDENRLEEDFAISIDFQIFGVVDEMDFLATPKLFYSFLALDDYLSEAIAEETSNYKEEDVTWKDLVNTASSYDDLSSFSYRLFAKDPLSINYEQFSFKNGLVLTSNSKTITSALLNIINACSAGLDTYLILTIIGTCLIMGIIIYYSYACDRKKSAILSCLGASHSDISSIYISESIILGCLSLAISIPLSIGLQELINCIIRTTTGFKSLIKIPWFSLYEFQGIFPIILLLGVLIVCLVSTLLPIFFSKRISIKEELADE